MENITTVSCTNISFGGHYTYLLVPFLVTVLQGDKDCEQAWYNEKMTLLSDGHEILNETGLVVGVTGEKITLSKCIKLYYNVTCHGSGLKFCQIYQVRNITTPGAGNIYEANTTTMPPDSAQPHIGIIIIITIIALLVLIGVIVAAVACYRYCKRRYVNYVRRSNQLPAEFDEGSSHGGENHRLNTMHTESEEPRDARVNGTVKALPLQARNDTDDES